MGHQEGRNWSALVRDGVVYMRLSGVLTREVVDVTRKLQLEGLAQRPSGVAILVDLGEAPALPPAEERRYATEMAARYPDGIVAHASIFRGSGFLAATIRSALTGIFMVARSPYPRSVVADAREGVRFLRPHLGVDASAEESMLRAFESFPAPR